jgi:hypothetical protein
MLSNSRLPQSLACSAAPGTRQTLLVNGLPASQNAYLAEAVYPSAHNNRLALSQIDSDNVCGTQVSSTCNPETQRSSGENYVADCKHPDDVGPARRRLIQPAGWVGSIFQLIS